MKTIKHTKNISKASSKRTLLTEKTKDTEAKETNKKDTDAQNTASNLENATPEQKESGVKEFLKKLLANTRDSVVASALDNFSLGNFREALCDIFKNEILSKKSADELGEIHAKLTQMPMYQKAKTNQDKDSRKDTNTSTDIIVDKSTCNVMFYAKEKENNILEMLKTIAEDIQKQAHHEATEMDKLKDEVKRMGLKNVGDGEVEMFGPIISNMIKAGKSKEEIAAEVDKLKGGVKESYDTKLLNLKCNKLILESDESKILITESEKRQLLFEAMLERQDILVGVTEYLISEGFLDDFASGAVKGLTKLRDVTKSGVKAAVKGTKDLTAAAFNKLPKNIQDTLKAIPNRIASSCKMESLMPLCRLIGISTLVVSGAWGLALIVSTIMLIDKHGKSMKASLERQFNTYLNSKGVIAELNFVVNEDPEAKKAREEELKKKEQEEAGKKKNKFIDKMSKAINKGREKLNKLGNEKLSYAARFFISDMTWRVINIHDQLKQPNKDFAKTILTNEIGKKFIDKINSHWDPVFGKQKNGEVIKFGPLLELSNKFKINEKTIKFINDFQENYEQIHTAMNKPQIDTRTQTFTSAKNAK